MFVMHVIFVICVSCVCHVCHVCHVHPVSCVCRVCRICHLLSCVPYLSCVMFVCHVFAMCVIFVVCHVCHVFVMCVMRVPNDSWHIAGSQNLLKDTRECVHSVFPLCLLKRPLVLVGLPDVCACTNFHASLPYSVYMGSHTCL